MAETVAESVVAVELPRRATTVPFPSVVDDGMMDLPSRGKMTAFAIRFVPGSMRWVHHLVYRDGSCVTTDIRTTLKYVISAEGDMRQAQKKIVRMALIPAN